MDEYGDVWLGPLGSGLGASLGGSWRASSRGELLPGAERGLFAQIDDPSGPALQEGAE